MRNGGSGGGNLYLPTLTNANLLYDVSQFAEHGIITIVTPPSVIPVLMSSYNLAGGGSWGTASAWAPNGRPNSISSIVNFTTNITVGTAVTLDGTKKVGKLIIGDNNNTNFFQITQGSGGNLDFDNGRFGRALLSKVQSNNTANAVDVINAPVLLTSNLDVNIGSGGATARLDIAGSISQPLVGGSKGLTVMGAGRLTLSGVSANTYTGTTAVFSRGAGDAGNPSLVLAKSISHAVLDGGSRTTSTVAGSNTITLVSGSTDGFYIGMPVTGNGLTRTFTATTNSGNSSVTLTGGNVGDFAVGMLITGNGIAPGTVITAINGSVIQLSLPATATAPGVTVTSNPVVTNILDGTRVQVSAKATATAGGITANFGALTVVTTAGSDVVTLLSGNTSILLAGMRISGNPNIPLGATVSSIIDGTSFRINNAANVLAGTGAVNVGSYSTTTYQATGFNINTTLNSTVVTFGERQHDGFLRGHAGQRHQHSRPARSSPPL